MSTRGWGTTTDDGIEMWDAPPTWTGESVGWRERALLLFYPKKFFLYRAIAREVRRHVRRYSGEARPFRILDVGCGTGGAVIDLKKMFGRSVEVVGVDVVELQIELARTKMKQHGVWAEFAWYDGYHLPYPDEYFDALYSSDVLGHVSDVSAWLSELARVIRPGGVLAMFSESALGPHAFIRQYLYRRGLNTDPHARYHVSLLSKKELRALITQSGFRITQMYSAIWAKFFWHPDELYPALQAQKKFFVLKFFNAILYKIKKRLHPYSTAAAEFYSLIEMMTLGRVVESQGYVIVGKKK
jgi:ubiquinone/menaquinone biosynthesis C-methylase UbiE